MKKLYYLSLLLAFTFQANAQYSYVVVDSMKSGIKFKDNALLITPDGYESPIHAFEIRDTTDANGVSFPAISFTDEAVGEVTGLFQIWASFDYLFPDVIDRADDDTIKIEFDIIVEKVGGSGESGRMNITLLTELPDAGITMEDFGIPAYHFWLFNGTYSAALAYGGSYGSEENVNPSWNSGAGGIYYNEPPNGEPVLFPNSPNYPEVPYSKDFSGSSKLSESEWIHFTWIIAPEMMHFFYRNTGTPEEENQEILFMAIPEDDDNISFINEVHETFAATMPPAYQWFETVNGIRFFNRGVAGRFYLSNLVISKTGVPLTTFSEFRSSKGLADEGDGTYELRIDLENPDLQDSTAIDLVLVEGDDAQIDNFESQTVVFEAGSDAQATVVLNITDDDEVGTDTLVFELQNIRGGFFPTIGENNQFTLIINDNDASGIENLTEENVSIYPNPATDKLNINFGDLGLANPVHIHVYTVNGSIVLQKTIQENTELDITELSNGIYNLEIESARGTLHKKLIINK